MRDYIDVGSSPAEENCAQLGAKEYDYSLVGRVECRLFIEVIIEALGPEPEGASLRVKGNPHDFGTYYSVVCYFEDNSQEATEYAYRCESEAPPRWPNWANRMLKKFKELAITDHKQAYEIAHLVSKQHKNDDIWKIQRKTSKYHGLSKDDKESLKYVLTGRK